MSENGCLYVVSTPIGNLEDMTFRAVRILKESALIAAEDTRVTAKLAQKYGISTRMISIRGERAKSNVDEILARLENGATVALVTDAGTPSVSDPGLELVSRAHDLCICVTPVPGASALAAAVATAGLPGEGVRFLGFLPRDGRRRKEILASIRTESALTILYESPRRTGETLAELALTCKDRRGAVLRELTKMHEEIVRAPLPDLASRFREGTLGEVTIAVEGVRQANTEDELTEVSLLSMIETELNEGRSVKDIAASLSKGLGMPRKAVYETALAASLKRMRGET
jgi:16S rRNA (cytidine1402-2'-O)-methyltransferase